jgi:hypothetical protein
MGAEKIILPLIILPKKFVCFVYFVVHFFNHGDTEFFLFCVILRVQRLVSFGGAAQVQEAST